MDTPRAPRFGLGIYWPDDYTDYLVHFEEPFEVFRLELDRDPAGPMIFWIPPDSPYESMADEQFDAFVRDARKYLGLEELVPLGTTREVELRVSEVPFPPILMVSNREAKFWAVVGLGAEPFTAFISSDENEPLIANLELGFETDSLTIGAELGDFAEAFYDEFYDRHDVLEKKNEQQGRHLPGNPRERPDPDGGFSRN